MTSAHLQQWIEHPELLNRDTLYELRTWVARYPYFQSLRLLYLKNLFLLHDASFGAELRKSVLYVADRRMLFYLIEGERYALKSSPTVAPASAVQVDGEPGVDRTLFLIDAFLASAPEEYPQDVNLDYSMDYTAYLLRGEEKKDGLSSNDGEAPKLRGYELIDGFLERNVMDRPKDVQDVGAEPGVEAEEEIRVVEEAKPDYGKAEEDGCFTETLAKIYIKQQRYEKALEIIKKLSLNYPKKNAYFADQIRFLEKLIINAKSK